MTANPWKNSPYYQQESLDVAAWINDGVFDDEKAVRYFAIGFFVIFFVAGIWLTYAILSHSKTDIYCHKNSTQPPAKCTIIKDYYLIGYQSKHEYDVYRFTTTSDGASALLDVGHGNIKSGILNDANKLGGLGFTKSFDEYLRNGSGEKHFELQAINYFEMAVVGFNLALFSVIFHRIFFMARHFLYLKVNHRKRMVEIHSPRIAITPKFLKISITEYQFNNFLSFELRKNEHLSSRSDDKDIHFDILCKTKYGDEIIGL